MLFAERELGQHRRGLVATQEKIRVPQCGRGRQAAPAVGAPLRDELGGEVPASTRVEVQDLQVGSPPRALPPPVEVVAGGPELGVEVLEPRPCPQRRYGHLHQHYPRRVHIEQVRAVQLQETQCCQWLVTDSAAATLRLHARRSVSLCHLPEDRGEDGGDGLRRGLRRLLGEHVELGRAVVRVEQGAVGHVVLADAEVGGGSEVDELHLAAAGDDEVGRLDVAVHDARRVDALQRRDQLPHHLLHHQRVALLGAQTLQHASEHEPLQVRREPAVTHIIGQRSVPL